MPAAIAVPLITGAVTAGATVYGSRQASGAQKRAAGVTDRANRAAEDEARLQREEDRRRFEIEEQNRQREMAAQEEERAYRRSRDEYQDKLLQEKEARMAPYRQMSAAALGNIGQMLGLDLGNSPLGQNLSAPRTPPPGPLPAAPSAIPPGALPTTMPQPGAPGNWRMLNDPRFQQPRTLGDMTGLR